MTTSAVLEFRDADARRAFRDAWRRRLIDVGYAKEDVTEIVRTTIRANLSTAFVYGRDAAERACDVANEVVGVMCKLFRDEQDYKEPSSELTPAMAKAIAIARRDGIVVAGKGAHAGRVERVAASVIRALIKRGLLVHSYSSEGGFAGRLP